MRVLIDACVLYPTVMREIVLGCARARLFEPRWSARICEEWARAAARLGTDGETFARGEIARLNIEFPRAVIAHNGALDQQLWLPDKNDIHVFSSAVSGSCDAILTSNAKDFPRNILAEQDLQRLDPDGFLMSLFVDHDVVVEQVANIVLTEAIRLSGQEWTMRKLLRKARLPRLGKALDH